MNFNNKYLLYSLFITALILRFYKLGSFSLEVDEGFTWFTAKYLSCQKLIENRLSAGHFPFYFLVMKLWLKLFGESEFSLRFPSFLASTLSLIIFYKLASKILISKIVIFCSTFMFFFSTYGIEISQEARMYAIALLFLLLVYYYFLMVVEERMSFGCLFKYSLSLFLFLLNGSIAILPYLGLLILLIFSAKKKQYRKILYLHIFIFILFLPLFIPIFSKSQFTSICLYHIKNRFELKTQCLMCLGWILRFFKDSAGMSWINLDTIPYSLTSYYLVIFSCFIFFYILGIIKQKFWFKKFTISMTMISFIPFILSYRFENRYLFFLFPLIILSWASFISFLYQRTKIYTFVFLTLWLNIFIIDIVKYYAQSKITWSEAANLIQKNEKENEEIWIFPRFCSRVFKYYYKGQNQIIEISPYQELKHKLDKNVWYVVWHNVKLPWLGGAKFDHYLRNYLSLSLQVKMVKCLEGRKGSIEVIHYVGKF